MPARLIGDVPLSGTERARRHREGLRARIAGLEAEVAERTRYIAERDALLYAALDELREVRAALAVATDALALWRHASGAKAAGMQPHSARRTRV